MKKLDPRQLKSIKKMHTAYLSLLLKGAEQISIHQLCIEANITRPTFYKSFNNIPQLRDHIHVQIFEQLKTAVTIENPRSFSEVLREDMNDYLTALFNHIYTEHIAYEIFLVHQPDAQFVQGLKAVLYQFIEDGTNYLHSQNSLIDIDINLLIAYVKGACLQSIIWWIQDGYNKSPQEMANTLVELSLYGSYKKS